MDETPRRLTRTARIARLIRAMPATLTVGLLLILVCLAVAAFAASRI